MNQKTDKMKTTIKPIIMAIVLVIAATGAMNAQRGMGRMMHDTTHMRMMRHDTAFMGRHGNQMMQMRHMNAPMHGQMCPGCGMGMGPGAKGGMRPGMGMGMGPGAGRGMRQGMGMGPGPEFRGGMGPDRFNRPGMNQGAGLARLESIPGLTDKQKKDIADLKQKQMDEMKKLREESMAKMKSLREDNRKKIMGLLTEEQKKYLEGNPGAPAQDVKKPMK
jgi:hypothetical protein